jgi:PAS domain S-box-containing protein
VYLTTALEQPDSVRPSAASQASKTGSGTGDASVLKRKLANETARREAAEDVLRETEQWFEQLTRNIGKFCWVTDPKKKQLVYISPGYEKLWSYTRERSYFSPQEWLASLNVADLNEKLGSNPAVQPKAVQDHEYQVVDSEGTMRWIRDRTLPIYDAEGKLVRLFGIAEDVTESKRMEESLLRNEWKSRALLSLLHVRVGRVRKDGTILEWADSDKEKLPGSGVVGKNLSEVLPTSLATEALRRVAEVLQTNQPAVAVGEINLSGALRTFEARLAVCGTDEVLAIVHEVTDEIRLQL